MEKKGTKGKLCPMFIKNITIQLISLAVPMHVYTHLLPK